MEEEEVMHNKTVNGEHLFENDKDYPAIIFITCMLSFFSVVGTTGNAFVLYVFSRKKDKNTSTIFILALASIDFVTCLFLIPFTIAMEFMYKRINNDAFCKIYQFFITSHVPFSAFIMVAIAFERYFCICRPWMKFLNVLFAKRIIVCLLAFSMSLGLITSLAYGVYHRKTTVFRNITVESNTRAIVNVSESNLTSNGPNVKFSLFQNCTLGRESLASGCNQNSDGENEKAKYIGVNDSTNGFTFTGFCYPNEIILSKEFRRVYQTFYALLFLFAFVIVFVLYALIYRSILVRRSKKLKSSLAYRYHHAKKSRSLLSYMFSRRQNVPEIIRMEPSESETNLNNQIADRRVPASDACLDSVSTASCQTTFVGIKPNDSMPRSGIYKGIYSHCKNISPEISNEESGISFSGDLSTKQKSIPIGLKQQEDIIKRTKSNLASRKSDNAKNANTVRKTVSNENEVTEQQDNYKITTYNIRRKDTRKSVREKNRLANIKTAGILFIVTVVFIIAFLPAWLMATKLIPPNMIVFYTYFIYNVANPVIYAFFNQAFQQEMKTVLKCNTRE